MKKVICNFLIILIMVTFSFGAMQVKADTTEGTGLIISESSTNPEGEIYAGQQFKLKLEFQNITENAISNIYMTLNSKSYHMISGNSSVSVGSISANKISDIITITLVYNGGTDTDLSVKLFYTEAGMHKEQTESISINAVPSSEAAPPKDTSKNKPVLSIMSGDIPEANAGGEIKIPLRIANNSNYAAVNVIVTPVLTDGTDILPFEISNLNLSKSIDFINQKDNAQVTFDFKVLPNASEKVYAVKFNFAYKNRSGDSFTSADTAYVKIKNTNPSTKIILINVKTIPETVKSNEAVQLSFDIDNTGASSVKDIKISLGGLNEAGFSVKGGTNVQYVNKLGAYGTQNIKFNLEANSGITGGSHAVTIKIEYKTDADKVITDEQQIFLQSDGGDSSSLVISDVKSPMTGVMPTEVFTVSFSLRNAGKGSAKNVKISVSGGEQIVPVSQSVQSLPELLPGQKSDFTFTMQPVGGTASKNYPVSIQVDYDGKEGDKTVTQTIKQYVGVYVSSSGSGSKGVPKIIINKYSCNPSIVKAGQNFDMDVSFLNTNSSKAIKNIKIYLTVNESTNESGSVFTPVDSSNTFYIDEIAPKSSVEKKITMFTIPNAKPKTYTVTANFEYEDSDGKEYKSTELFGIPVAQPSKLQIGEIVLPDAAFAGQSAAISAEYYNLGKVQLSNLMIKVEGDFEGKSSSKYIGNFDSGSNDVFDTEVIPAKEGECKGRLVFSFDEPNGDHKEISKEFSLNVTQAPAEPQMSQQQLAKMAKSQKFKKNKKIIIIGGIVLGVVVCGIIIRKKKIKKRGMTLDE